MAIGSKKGACSSNTQRAKAGCLYHNRRNEHSEHVPGYVNKSLSGNNRTVFEDASISERKSIAPLVRQAEKLYTEKTHQKCQKSFTPYRESVFVIKPTTTDEQLMNAVQRMEHRTGWKCLGVWAHLDEGHHGSKYIEGDTDYHINYHAHVLWSCQNTETGKAIPCTLAKLQGMQDDLAAATGMERGNKTGKRHMTVTQMRIDALERRCDALEEVISNMDAKKAVKERLLAFVGRSTADKKLRALKREKEALTQSYEQRIETLEEKMSEMRKNEQLGKETAAADAKREFATEIARAAHLDTCNPQDVCSAVENLYKKNRGNRNLFEMAEPAWNWQKLVRNYAKTLRDHVEKGMYSKEFIRDEFETLCKEIHPMTQDAQRARTAVAMEVSAQIAYSTASQDCAEKSTQLATEMAENYGIDNAPEQDQHRGRHI